jgi:hypothetical protein
MNSHDKFDAIIAKIHSSDRIKGGSMDVRHEEFKALTDAFLGEDYDPAKLADVESLQVKAQDAQTTFYNRYSQGHMSPEQYVRAANHTWGITFVACHRILGTRDFQKLFDATPSELGAHIDLNSFLASEGLAGDAAQTVIQADIVQSRQFTPSAW